MNTEKLKKAQKLLESFAKDMIDDAMTDYAEARDFLNIIESLDKFRRKAWNDDKFKVYEQMTEEFIADDIPF